MNRVEAIRSIQMRHPGAAFIFSNGLTSREACRLAEGPGQFYLLHAMGEALSVGVGLKSARPDLEVVVVDGDGNAAMGLASWNLLPLEGLHYYVLANGTYETTGSQPIPPLRAEHPAVQVVPVEPGTPPTPNPPLPSRILEEFQQWLEKQEEGGG